MHRSKLQPRLVAAWSLLVILAFHIGAISAQNEPLPLPGGLQLTAAAQGEPAQPKKAGIEIKQDIPFVTMLTGTVQSYQMASKEKLKKVENQFATVLFVRPVEKDFTSILLEAKSPGRTRLRIVGESGRVEEFDVLVESDRLVELRKRIKELQTVIPKTVPQAAIDVNSSEITQTIVVSGSATKVAENVVVKLTESTVGGLAKELNWQIVYHIQTPVERDFRNQQIQLEVIIATVNRSMARNMSFSWTNNGTNWMASSLLSSPLGGATALATGIAANATSLNQGGSVNLPFAILNQQSSFLSFLQALRTENVAKILAEPRIVTMSGHQAEFTSGGETPLLTSTSQGAPSVSYKPFGTVVKFKPTLRSNNKIELEVEPEVSDIDQSLGINLPGNIVPGFRVRKAKVLVQVEDGQTLAIGGLIQNNISATVSRVPFLGDLPFIGTAFTSKTFTENEQELVILVTARLVDPIDCTKFPKYLPGRETRVPDDFEFFLEGILEAPRGQRNVVFHPHYYKPAFHNAPNAGQIPCGPNGCAPTFGNAYGTAMKTTSTPTVVSIPAPSATPLPELQPIPTSNVRLPAEGLIPTVRDLTPSLGPVTPVLPSIPGARESESRQVLPPIDNNFGSR